MEENEECFERWVIVNVEKIPVRLKIILLLLATSTLLFYVGIRVQLNKGYSASIQARTGADFAGFNQALTSYKQLNGQLPTTSEGLDALVHKPSDAGTSWHQLFDFVPKDFWRHPYHYRLAPDKASWVRCLLPWP